MNNDKLTTTIFRHVAEIAKWYFNFSNSDGGSYSAKEVINMAAKGGLKFDDAKAESSNPPELHGVESYITCGEVTLKYGDCARYSFPLHCAFSVLDSFRKIAKGVTASEKANLCRMTKEVDKTGKKLVAVINLPKNKTKHVLVKCDVERICGLYVSREDGYIASTNGKVVNVCKADIKIISDIDIDIVLPYNFAKMADGKVVEVYKDDVYNDYTAVCGDEQTELTTQRYPKLKPLFGIVNDDPSKGKVELNSSIVRKKAKGFETIIIECKKDEAIITTRNEYGDSFSKTRIPAKTNSEFGVELKGAQNIMPACHTMYTTETNHLVYFLGDGFASVIMQRYNSEIGYHSYLKGDKLVPIWELFMASKNPQKTEEPELKPETQKPYPQKTEEPEQKPEPQKTEQQKPEEPELKPTKLQITIIRSLCARRGEQANADISTMTEAINLIKNLRK